MLLIICQVFYTVAEHSRSIMSVGKICIVIVCVCGNDRRVTKMVLSRRLWNRLTSPMRQNWRSTVWRLTSWASVDTRTSSESTSRTISTANCVYVYAAICQLLYIRIYTTLQYNTIQYNTIQYITCPSTKVSLISMKFGMHVEVDEWCRMICSMTRCKVEVTSPSKLEVRPFLVLKLKHNT